MEDLIQMSTGSFLLIFIRCISFFTVTPVFGRREFPAVAKIGLSIFAALIAFPLVTSGDNNLKMAQQITILGVLRELLVGLMLGYVVLLVFSALYIAGDLVDTEIGFRIVNVMDPQSRTQIPLTGNFYYLLAIVIFLSINGHHQLISAIINSFNMLPLGGSLEVGNLLNGIVHIFKSSYTIGIKVALPIVAMVFLTDFAMGIIARTVPQMNVFVVGLPVKIFVGFWGMVIVLPMFVTILDVIFNYVYEGVFSIIQGMWPIP